MMRSLGSRRQKFPLAYRFGTKSVGSAAANPGSEPSAPPIQANSSNVVGVTSPGPGSQNATTVGRKYKYKYKYPPPDFSKRKRQDDEGVDDLHMQQKALPGEQYRGGAAMRQPPYKKPKMSQYYKDGKPVRTDTRELRMVSDGKGGSREETMEERAKRKGWVTEPGGDDTRSTLEQKAEPGEQYLGGASTSNENKQMAAATKTVKKGKKKKEVSMAPPPPGAVKPQVTSSVPNANVQSVDVSAPPVEQDVIGQGKAPGQAYQGEEQKAIPGGDPNRTDPITPATGSRQTPATANSIVSVEKLKKAAEHTARTLGPEAVHGNARERANMGKGALDTYEFQGPYDYPVYPGGRPDDSLTMMGAWRTDGGHDSSLWYSKKTAKGADARRNKYWKWSMKGGGRWRKMTKDEMVNVFQKGGNSDNRFYGTRAGLKFTDFQRQTLSNRDRDVALARIGNARVVNSEHGDFSRGRNKYVDANKVGIAKPGDAPPAATIGNLPQGPKDGPDNQEVGLTGGTNIPDDWDLQEYGMDNRAARNFIEGAAVNPGGNWLLDAGAGLVAGAAALGIGPGAFGGGPAGAIEGGP